MRTFALALLLLVACAREIDVSPPPPGCRVGAPRECYGGPAATRDVGLCRHGTQHCESDGRWGRCQGAVLPAPEGVCDHRDNDCDGVVDNEVIYALDPASREERREPFPMGDLHVARAADRVVAAWTVGISSKAWEEQLHLVALSTELDGSRFRVEAESRWMDQPPIVARDLLVAPEGDAGLRATVHAAVESYGCTQHVPPLPLSDCGERFYRHDGRSDAVDEPAAVARRGSSLRAVLTEGAILVPEQVDGGGVSLRTLAGDELTDGDARRSLPLRVDEPTLRGLRVNDRIVWVSTFGDTLQRIETDLTGAPTAVHPPHALNAGGASLTALERVQDTLWAALATRDGMKICRWPLANPAQVSVIDVGIGSDADLAYDADADQVYFCSVAFGTAAVQRLTTDGRLLPHPRPATFHVDTNARCSVAATARGAVVFTRQHHDGVVSWARYGCPSVRAPQ